jgi:hypothetical protein
MLGSAVAAGFRLRAEPSDGWAPLFDGRSLKGWRASENAASWKVVDGLLTAAGPRSHLFYEGPVRGADFKNFELKVDYLTRPGANSGVYFHTAFQQEGWPARGFEVQVNHSHAGEGNYRERKKGGSLYGVRNVYKSWAGDDQWNQLHIAVRGKNVQIRLNGMLLVDYVEADPPVILDPKAPLSSVLGRGTFALQCHDPNSKVMFRNILVRPLADDMATPGEPPAADEIYRQLMDLGRRNYPVVDYHAHLKGGLTIGELLGKGRREGIQYGVAVNCGRNFPVQDDAGIDRFLEEMKGQPVFIAMQAEGREWVKMFSPAAVAKFDYVFTDSMTFSDDSGRRMRLWIKDEVGEIGDRERFMEMLVDRTVGILDNEPIDIYVNPTFLPDAIAADYDRLWTPARMQRVVDALKRNGIAMEINNRYRLPGAAFIRLAKSAGVKFAFGTNNGGRDDLGRLEYGLEMVRQCGLTWQDFFVPNPEKGVRRVF